MVRKSGLSAGKIDVYYYSPEGRKFRSKAQLVKALRDKIDLTNFDFRAGKMMSSNTPKRFRHDVNVSLPIRQTASIFKQPVTVVRNHPNSKTRTDLKHGIQEPPRQLYWEKRLQNFFASDVSGDKMPSFHLPSSIQSFAPDLMGPENLLHGIAAALHIGNQPVTGQTVLESVFQKHPTAYINADQPLIHSVTISDLDIQKQEARVLEARRRLQQAMNTVIVSPT